MGGYGRSYVWLWNEGVVIYMNIYCVWYIGAVIIVYNFLVVNY